MYVLCNLVFIFYLQGAPRPHSLLVAFKGRKWGRQNQCIWSHVDLGRPSNTLPALWFNSQHILVFQWHALREANDCLTGSRIFGQPQGVVRTCTWRLPLASATREVCAQSAQHELLSMLQITTSLEKLRPSPVSIDCQPKATLERHDASLGARRGKGARTFAQGCIGSNWAALFFLVRVPRC